MQSQVYATAGAQLGSPRGAGETAAVEKSLDAIVRQLENQLTVIAEGVNRVQIFKTRLVNQRPQLQGGQEGNPKGVNPPTPGSIEGRLNYLSSVAGHIGEMLHEVAADLDRAA